MHIRHNNRHEAIHRHIQVHIYEFEVSEDHRDKPDFKTLDNMMWSKGGYGSPTIVGLVSTSAIKASIELLDMGYTPVKLLNPREHD
jgi:hypothetical protein